MSGFLDTIFNPWLGLALKLPPFWAILIISAFITILVTVAYKYTTDQREMKRIKEDLKKYQKEMRETKDTTKLMGIQKKSMELNMTYMKSSFKSTLYTFIPIIIIFTWLNMHIAFEPILPNTEFTVTAQFGEGANGNISMTTVPDLTIINGATQQIINDTAIWKLKGDAGEYNLKFQYNLEEISQDKTKKPINILITNEKTYKTPDKYIPASKLQLIKIGNKAIKPFGDNFNIFGWHPGWLATYIIISIALSTLLRKLMKVY